MAFHFSPVVAVSDKFHFQFYFDPIKSYFDGNQVPRYGNSENQFTQLPLFTTPQQKLAKFKCNFFTENLFTLSAVILSHFHRNGFLYGKGAKLKAKLDLHSRDNSRN